MELNRRKFIGFLMTAGAVVWSGAWKAFTRRAPTRVTQAIRNRHYPGKVQPLVEEDLLKPGHWRG